MDGSASTETVTKPAEKLSVEDKVKQKKGKWEKHNVPSSSASVPRPSQSYGFSLDSDEREEESTGKPRPADDSRERKERGEEAQRPSWERRTSADDRRKRREDSEPRLFISCDENQEPPEGNEKSEKGQATLSLGMDLNLDWMTLDNFQKHLNGDDEILSGPPLSPSELRDAVKSGDYMAVKLALNSKEDYNLEQEASTIDEKRSYEGQRNLIEERNSSGTLRLTSSNETKRNKEGIPAAAKENIPQDMDGSQNDIRQTLLDQIRVKGSYENNCDVSQSGEGENVTKKQLKKPATSVRDFLPCQHCLAFYRKTDLWRHERACKIRKGDQKSSEKTKRSTGGSSVSNLLPVSEFFTGSCKEIIQIMHQDDISRHIQLDPLICKYGNTLSAKYDHDKSQFAYIAQKMRELGRFVLAVNELDKTVKYLHEICLPSRFELAVEGVKKVSGFDPTSSKFKTISLVSKIGYSLKRAAEIAFGESRMTEDNETESELKKFIELLDTKWSACFSRKVLACSLKQEAKKVDVDKSTVTEDLIKLHRFITGEEDKAKKELKVNASTSNWKKLGESTLANVCLFNRGRVGNIGRLHLKTYTQRVSGGSCMLSADQVRKSAQLELELSSSFTRLELEGQYGRNMLVLLTDGMVSSIDLLVENREQAGVSKTNPYLFARSEGPSFIRGLDCVRRAAVECGVKNPEALLSSSVREQIATCWQLMSISEQELDKVAKMVGRSSEECHRLSQTAALLEEISKDLMKMNRTLPTSRPSTKKDGTYDLSFSVF
ncbi:hypothetical protein XENOCAPTIV_029364 [Xenoophorus captivus]|uniref:Uncharacterized protein n=1 Tax=Xenoophorus captivus TaxID=1517983 RepID=A0ABV0S572_9TELE